MQPDKPSDLVGRVDLGVQKVPYKGPCINTADLPVRPRTAMPDPSSADINMKANGAGVDIENLNDYADKLEAAVRGCYSVEEHGP